MKQTEEDCDQYPEAMQKRMRSSVAELILHNGSREENLSKGDDELGGAN